ncbi:MAG: nitrilase-related carbon-nitrogen hydrolase [Anaerolineae bacterium]
MKPQRQYCAAALQFEPEHAAKDRNLDRLSHLIREGAANGAKVIVTPEMATVGIFWENREHIAPYVETIPGYTTDYFAKLAGELDIYVVIGMAEVNPATNAYYNSAALIGPDGLVGVHRKVHAYVSDPLWAVDGDLGFQTWETPLGKLGVMICMDANYPESSRLLALHNADVLLVPVTWLVEVCPAPLWITRAFENGLHAVCANRWGSEMGHQISGGSCVLNPDGSIQNCAANESGDVIVYGEIDLDDPRRQRLADDSGLQPLGSRRPELYGSLLLNRYLWDSREMQAQFTAHPLPDGSAFNMVVMEWDQPLPVEQRLAQLDALLDGLDGALPQLIVLPELSFSGAPDSAAQAVAYAQTVEGEIVQALAGWCAGRRCYLVAGIVEQGSDGLYNTQVLIGPEGLCATYRKTHLSGTDLLWATAGDRLVWADTPLGRIGLLSGTDLLFPEPVRCLAIQSVDVVCVSAALGQPDPIYQRAFLPDKADGVHWHLARTRAGENDVYIAFANWRNIGHMGHSGIFFGPSLFAAPQVEALVGQGDYAALTIDMHTDPHSALRTKPGIQRRFPSHYGLMTAPKEAPTSDGQAGRRLITNENDRVQEAV